ncbi:hypothetical protein ACOSP7_002803 [Xanthoceras sorbifolium]
MIFCLFLGRHSCRVRQRTEQKSDDSDGEDAQILSRNPAPQADDRVLLAIEGLRAHMDASVDGLRDELLARLDNLDRRMETFGDYLSAVQQAKGGFQTFVRRLRAADSSSHL